VIRFPSGTAVVWTEPQLPVPSVISGTWLGKISDSRCGASHSTAPPTVDGQVLTDAECTELCLAAGAKYVFVSDRNVYSIANQDHKELKRNIGQRVELVGDLAGTAITVSKISPTTKKESKRP
jgi:hypothetical protein